MHDEMSLSAAQRALPLLRRAGEEGLADELALVLRAATVVAPPIFAAAQYGRA